jgi:hypothetical protein
MSGPKPSKAAKKQMQRDPSDPRHGGSGYAYSHFDCRCEPCTTANRERTYKYRAKVAGTLAPDDPRHGTLNAYNNYGCRCEPCTLTNSESCKDYARRRAANGGKPLTVAGR